MKKIIVAVGFTLSGVFANAQHGLEKISVEKYYVSDAKDAAATAGLGGPAASSSLGRDRQVHRHLLRCGPQEFIASFWPSS